jgi:hypothetical protein
VRAGSAGPGPFCGRASARANPDPYKVTTSLLLILIAGAAVGGWALLNALGAERQRLLVELEAKRPKTPASPPSPPPERPIVVKPVAAPRPPAARSGADAKGPNNKSDKPGGKDKAGAKAGRSEAKSSSRR